MGTRAQFFLGNPEQIDKRIWLGCTAWDSYPDGWIAPLAKAKDQAEFAALVKDLVATRDDYCDPSQHGYPFPWVDDLFLTDYTYAWFDGKVMATCFHAGWIEMEKLIGAYRRRMETAEEAPDDYFLQSKQLASNVPAPAKWDMSAPDSIMIFTR